LIAVGKTRRRGSKIILTPSTLLTHEHRDSEHRVLVGHDGSFEYRGMRYTSLSKIATEIVGSPSSGSLFFGLIASAKKKDSRLTKKHCQTGAMRVSTKEPRP
jgi:hypothetical protein